MNKLEGFLEFNKLSIPTVDWKWYQDGSKIEGEGLWTVRCAVMRGVDFNLPRLIGAEAERADAFASNLLKTLGPGGMVIYYPFFTAEISGNLKVSANNCVIECVTGDLWNLVTYGKAEQTLVCDLNAVECSYGGKQLLSEEVISMLLRYAGRLRRAYRADVAEGKEFLAEWSIVPGGTPSGKPNIVFYELRTV